MKEIFKIWHSFLTESKEKVVTFDFDDTLSLSSFETVPNQPDPDLEDFVHHGPNQETIDIFNDYKKKGYTIYVVTARYEDREQESAQKSHQVDVKTFLDTYNLKVDGIFYTNGGFKAETLLDISNKHGLKPKELTHYDDYDEDVQKAQAVGINAIEISDPYRELLSEEEISQRKVRLKHARLKYRLLGKGKNKHNVGKKMKKPSYKRSKSAPPGAGGS